MAETDTYKRFQLALISWLRTSTDLATLTGHTSSNIRIFKRVGDEQIPRPCLAATIEHLGKIVLDVDGLYETQVVCKGHAAGDNGDLLSLQLVGAVEKLATQNTSTQQDASFASNNITTIGIRSIGVSVHGEQNTERDSASYMSEVVLIIRWRDDTT